MDAVRYLAACASWCDLRGCEPVERGDDVGQRRVLNDRGKETGAIGGVGVSESGRVDKSANRQLAHTSAR